jgi:CshA-type fibril repeat protein
VVGFLTLGSSVNADNLTSLYGNANGNAVNPGATIPSHPGNGVTSFRDLSSADVGTTYSIPLTLAGVEASAYLCGWIDFNRDGVMSFSERTCAPNPGVNATSATLNWTVPDTLVPGPTYARIRLSYDPIPLPTGKVSSGEVEDYSLTISASALPDAVDDTSTNGQDVNQIISPLTNDQFEDGSPALNSSLRLCGYGTGPFVCNKLSLTVPGEGVYTVNSDGTVTFDPFPSFVGTATSVQYQISDTQSRTTTATITPTVTPAPSATPDTTSDFVNIVQSKSVLTNDTAGYGILSASSLFLCGTNQTTPNCSALTVSVEGGVYSVNQSTGVVTFTPSTDWAGVAPAVTYQVSNGSQQVTSSTYTPTVISQPDAEDDTSSGAYDTNQIIDVLFNDVERGADFDETTVRLCDIDDPATPGNETQTPPNCDKTSLSIPGEGTYSVNEDGTVTFNPLPTFVRTVSTPVRYQVADELGEIADALITPTVALPPLPTALPEAISDAYDTNQVYTPISNDTPGASSFPLLATTVLLCAAGETAPNCTLTTLTVDGQGTYTVNTTTGEVTFNPLPTFTGPATPMSYQA